jgi:general secretion pathway protein A
MYESFYGLREKPFNLLPDPEYLYMSQGHENAYTHLVYAISENKGFVVITGEIGSGKTTLINYLLGKIDQDIQVGLINNTAVPPTQFIKMVCQEFELDVSGLDQAGMLDRFQEFLLKQFAERMRVILILDEAQNLPTKTLEQIRMFSNLEAEKHHLIQMILVGQPELRVKLQRRDLRQFAQRVTVHCHLEGLKEDEVSQYIRYRLGAAGARSLEIFKEDAVKLVSRYSRGIPRLINILCDTSLVYGYADELEVIDKEVIESVIKNREAGGIFCEPDQSETPPVLAAPAVPILSGEAEGRLSLLEKRLALLENVVASLDQKLERMDHTRNGRDTIMLELFKVLKESMESRFGTLMRLGELKRKVDQADNKRTPVKHQTNPPGVASGI